MLGAAVASIAILLAGPRAHAQSEAVVAGPAETTATPNKLALVLGLASPWGEIGFSYQRMLSPALALDVEAGPSLTLADQSLAGLWAAGEVGFESSFGHWTLGFGAGAAILVAGQVREPICFDSCPTWQPGTWLPEVRLVVGRNF